MANAYSEQGTACSQLIVLLKNYSEFGAPLELGALGPHVAPLLIRHWLASKHHNLNAIIAYKFKTLFCQVYIIGKRPTTNFLISYYAVQVRQQLKFARNLQAVSRGDVTFDDVHFRYPARPTVGVLCGLSMRIEAGSTVALVGSSGSGKTTAIELLQRFYDPNHGTVVRGADLPRRRCE